MIPCLTRLYLYINIQRMKETQLQTPVRSTLRFSTIQGASEKALEGEETGTRFSTRMALPTLHFQWGSA